MSAVIVIIIVIFFNADSVAIQEINNRSYILNYIKKYLFNSTKGNKHIIIIDNQICITIKNDTFP